MKTAKEAVANLTLRELVQLVREYEEFERVGHTGDTLLRRTTTAFAGEDNKCLIINMLGTAMEAYRLLAIPYIKKFDRNEARMSYTQDAK